MNLAGVWYILILSIINWNGSMFQRRTLGLVISLLLLTACGQKGDLYLQTKNPQLQKQKPQPITVKQQNKTQKPTATDEKALPEPDDHMR